MLSERIIPNDNPNAFITGNCEKWKDGLVFFGTYGVLTGTGSGTHLWKLNNEGNLVWEKKFKASGRNLVSGDFAYTLSESYLGIPTDSREPASDYADINIHRISLSGKEEKTRTIPGFLGDGGLIASPAFSSKNTEIYMFGTTKPSDYKDNLARRVLVKFDSDLKELSRRTVESSPPIASLGIISQSDGSLFHYGTIGKGPAKNYPAMGAAYSNADFTQQTILSLEVDEFDEFPKLNVAASAGEMDHFVTASRLFLKDFFDKKGAVNLSIEEKFHSSTNPGHYLVIQFVHVTH